MCVLCALDCYLVFIAFRLIEYRSYQATVIHVHYYIDIPDQRHLNILGQLHIFRYYSPVDYFPGIYKIRPFYPPCSLTLVSDDRRPTGRHTCGSDTFHP